MWRLPLVPRVLACGLGVMLVLVGVSTFAPRAFGDGSTAGVAVAGALGVVLLLAGITLAVRAYRLGVEVRDGEVVVRGVVRTTRIPRTAITHVHVREATLVWRRPDGAVRRGVVGAFATRVGGPSEVRASNERSMTEIRKAIAGG